MSMLTRRHTLAALGAAGAASLLPGFARRARAQGTRKVVLTQSTDGFLYVPIQVARARRYFEEEGIEPEVVVTGGGSKAIAAVVGGSAHVYVGNAASQVNALSKGQPLLSFAAVMTEFASNLVMQGDLARERGIGAASPVADKVAALKGLKVGITAPGSATDQILRYLLQKQGIQPDRDVTVIPVGGSGPMIAAFSQKRIDAFVLSSPTAETAVVKHGGVMLINFSRGEYEPIAGILYMSLIAKKDWLEQNSETAVAVCRALARAERLINEKPQEAKAAIGSFYEKTEPAVFDQAWESNVKAYPPTPVIAAAAMQKAIDFMNATEEEKTSVTVAQAMDNRYAEAAVRGL